MFPLPGFFIKDFPFRHFAHQHFFQRHGLCAELQTIGIVYLAAAMLIFHGHGLPQAAAAMTRRLDPCETLPHRSRRSVLSGG